VAASLARAAHMPSQTIVTIGAPVITSATAKAISLATISREYMRRQDAHRLSAIHFDLIDDSIRSTLHRFMPKTRHIVAAAAIGVSASVATLSAQAQAPAPTATPTFTSSVTETVDVAVCHSRDGHYVSPSPLRADLDLAKRPSALRHA